MDKPLEHLNKRHVNSLMDNYVLFCNSPKSSWTPWKLKGICFLLLLLLDCCSTQSYDDLMMLNVTTMFLEFLKVTCGSIFFGTTKSHVFFHHQPGKQNHRRHPQANNLKGIHGARGPVVWIPGIPL